jgi:hypothetical protein
VQHFGRERSDTSRLPKNEEVGGILYVATQNFELFSKIQDQNKKTQKNFVLLSNAYPRIYHSYADLIWQDGTFRKN